MPRRRRKAGVNAEPIVLTKGARLIFTTDGFSANQDANPIAEVLWNQVEAIYGFTRIENGIANVCLDFHLPNDENGDELRVVVFQNVEDWEELKSLLPKQYPNLRDDWEKSVHFDEAIELADLAPQYVANITEVWKRKDD